MPPERPTARRLPRSRASAAASLAAGIALAIPRPFLALGGFLEAAIGHQTLEALFDQLPGLFLLQVGERLGERLLQRGRGCLGIAVRAAQRLRHDLVDEAERLQAPGGDAE